MKAIQTRYHGATNTRGSRITARAEGGNRVSIPYPHELSGQAVHKAAAVKLCEKLGWSTNLVGGGLPNGDYAFCFAVQADENARLREALARVSTMCGTEIKAAGTPGTHPGTHENGLPASSSEAQRMLRRSFARGLVAYIGQTTALEVQP